MTRTSVTPICDDDAVNHHHEYHQIAEFSSANHGVFAMADWIACELSDDQLAGALERSEVERMGKRSYRFCGHPVTRMQLLTAGLTDLGPEAAIAGNAAARLLCLDGFEHADAPAFCVPRELRSRQTVGAVRSVRGLRPSDVVVVDGLRTLSASRLIVEESGRWTTNELRNAIDSACRMGWTSPAYLGRQLDTIRRQGKAGVRRIDVILDDARTESWLERTMLQLVRRAHLSAPTTQVRIATGGRSASGRTGVARVDFEWRAALVVVEVAGHRFHSTRAQLQRDHQRHTELTAMGCRVLTFTYDDLADRPAWVVQQLRAVLALNAA